MSDQRADLKVDSVSEIVALFLLYLKAVQNLVQKTDCTIEQDGGCHFLHNVNLAQSHRQR